MDYPFIKCLSPQWINNRNTGERMLVGCGQCVACKNLRAMQASLKCKLESKYSKYCFFITLTYDETFIPCMVPVAIKGTKGQEHYFLSTCNRLGEAGQMITHHPYRLSQLDALQKKLGSPHGIPYLSVREAQLFLKRLRKNLKSFIDAHNFDQWNYNIQHGLDQNYKLIKNEKLRYFLCGEYGPKHLRPHFHLLVWIDGQEISEVLGNLVNQSWKFGATDIQLVQNDASSYVANYVNSLSYIPSVYHEGKCKPFCLHSNFLGEKFYRSQAKEIYKLSATEFVRRSEVINDSVSEFVLWRSIKNTFYPRCREYASSSAEQRKFLYTLYAQFRGRKETHRTPSGLASDIIREIEENIIGFDIPKNDISEVARYYNSILDIYQNARMLKDAQFSYENGIIDDSQYLESVCHYAKNYEYFKNFIYRDLATSKHFLEFVCNGSYNMVDIDCKLIMIDNFYNALDLASLNEQLKHQEVMLDSGELSIEDVEFFYDAFDLSDLVKKPFFKLYKQSVIEKVDERMKHKKQNDANRILFVRMDLI